MTLKTIPIVAVAVGSRLREVGEPQVAALMESIREVGMLNTITVGEKGGGGFPLIAGAHRLEACKRLGHTEIAANVVTLSELQQKLAECDENLSGTVLTPAERAQFTAVRKSVYLALHPETAQHVAGAHGANTAMGRATQSGDASDKLSLASFAEDTATRTGVSRRTVEREARRAAAILPQTLEAIAGTELDNGANLDKLAKLTPEVQAKVGDHLRSGNVIAARVTLTTSDTPKPDGENVRVFPNSMTAEVRRELDRIASAWDAASDEAQARFLRRLEKRGVKVPRLS